MTEPLRLQFPGSQNVERQFRAFHDWVWTRCRTLAELARLGRAAEMASFTLGESCLLSARLLRSARRANATRPRPPLRAQSPDSGRRRRAERGQAGASTLRPQLGSDACSAFRSRQDKLHGIVGERIDSAFNLKHSVSASVCFGLQLFRKNGTAANENALAVGHASCWIRRNRRTSSAGSGRGTHSS